MRLNHQSIRFPQEKLAKYLNTTIFIGMFAFIITSCTSATTPALPTLVQFPTETPAADTSSATQESDSTSSGFVTQEVEFASTATEDIGSGFVTQEVELASLATEEVVETEEVFRRPDSVRNRTDDGSLFVVVDSVGTIDTMPNLPEAPEGEQYVIVMPTIANLTDEAIIIEASSLTLIDQQFNRYAPVQPEDFLRNTVYGGELPAQTTMRNPVRFSIPADAIPYLLEWCPYNDCETETLQTLLP